MIRQLSLYHYRNYPEMHLSFKRPQIVLWGENGSGKTNILEAISLFSLGHGLRGSQFSELQYNSKENQIDQRDQSLAEPRGSALWAVKMNLDGEIDLSTGLIKTSANQMRRLCKVQGNSVRSPAAFQEHLKIVSITPLMDHLFIDAASCRRKFVDDLISSYNSSYSTSLSNYEKAAKQRLRILKHEDFQSSSSSLSWLTSLEQMMAEQAQLILKERQKFVSLLRKGQEFYLSAFPQFESSFEGKAEGVALEDYQEILRDNRIKDGLIGMTSFGCHRSDWVVIHKNKGRPVHDCSTGEQKIILISVVFSFVSQLLKNFEGLVVLLLDDVVARLDELHRHLLFEQVALFNHNQEEHEDPTTQKGFQVFFSGTDFESFAGVTEAQFFHIQEGQVIGKT